MTARAIQVRIDDRVRLMSAALAATNWPEREQARHRHRAHVHARNTSRRAAGLGDHPAIRNLQSLLNQGTPLEALFTYALSLSWPELIPAVSLPWVPLHWHEQLGDFCGTSGMVDWWIEESDVWQRAGEQAFKIVSQADLYAFFKPFVGDIAEQFVFMPNISYPSDGEIGIRLNSELTCIAPPRIAWGDNEPWPFDEDPAHLFRGVVMQYGRLLMVSYLRQNAAVVAHLATMPLPVNEQFAEMAPTWHDQFTSLFVSGAVALFLERAISPKEAQAYILMEARLHGMSILPAMVSVLRRYVAEYHEGRYTGFANYLPVFPKHLRIAKGMESR